MPRETKIPTASVEEIRRIVGDFDAAIVTSIRETGATAAEVIEAYTWFSADDQLGSELGRTRSGPVGAVYEILMAQETEDR
jgi:hypothetical protein